MKQPTQQDVARLAGVSRATVSYVLNGQTNSYVTITEETRERVLQAVNTLGYHPNAMAQSLRSGMTATVGLLIPDMHNPHYWQIAHGVEQAVQPQGYDMLLMSADLNPDREVHILQALSRRRIDGLILLLTFPEHIHQEIEMLVEQRKAIVLLNGPIPSIDGARTSYAAGARDAMTHLYHLGHRRIGLIYGVAQSQLGLDRLNAYHDSLENFGLPLDEGLIVYCGTTLEDGYQAARRLLNLAERPTAVVVINDLLAIGALHASHECGLHVPQDISIVSFDDIAIAAYVNPPLTTVRMDAEELGRAAARLIFKRLQEPTLPPQEVFISSQLVVRASSGPAPQGDSK